MPVSSVYSRKLQEVSKYAYQGNFGTDSIVFYMKNSKHQALPDSAKTVLLEASKYYEYKFQRYQLEANPGFEDEFRAAGMQITYPTPEQDAAFREALRVPVQQKFREEAESALGAAAIDELIAAAEK
jgi:TRAP-type C4-dicarboxylate transport system substrate-binding protein